MVIESLNIGKEEVVQWRGKNIRTGIYKNAVKGPLFLGSEDVKDDAVIDRRYHGGIDKACYAYSYEAYEFWRQMYPESEFNSGFFGENLTIKGLDEAQILIGSQYKVGEALIEVSQPREPCFKLGIRFGSQKILKPFVKAPYPGIYFRVIKPGYVSQNDQLALISENATELTILEVYRLLYNLDSDPTRVNRAINSLKLGLGARNGITKQFANKF